MRSFQFLMVGTFALLLALGNVHATEAQDDQEAITLLGTLAKWQYPDAKVSGAKMSDAATVNSKGQRTVASIVCKAQLSTGDSVDKVLDYYRKKLGVGEEDRDFEGLSDKEGVAVLTDELPSKIKLITICAERSTTTLVISKDLESNQTHITWSHYLRLSQ